MPSIAWIRYTERVVAKGSPKYADVTNRPLRQLVMMHGWDPDDVNFSGLHHFPSGVFTNTIEPEDDAEPIEVDGKLQVNAFIMKTGTTIFYKPDGVTPALQYDSTTDTWTFFGTVIAPTVLGGEVETI